MSVWTGPERCLCVCGEAVQAEADLATAVRVIADEPDPALRDVLERTGFRLTDESYSQLRAWIDYAPDADLDSLRIPTLAIYGTRDPLIPVQASVDRHAQLTPTVRSRVFVGADHRLCIDGTLAPGYLDAVTACAPHRLRRPATRVPEDSRGVRIL